MAVDESSPKSNDSGATGGMPGVADLLSLLGGASPLIAVGRVVETVTQVAGEIVKLIATLNDTMNELNRVAHRVNDLLDEIEGPIKEIVPTVQATVKQARGTLKKVDGVIGQVGTLPADVTKAVSTLGDLAGRLAPLTQFAEMAGGMFGMKSTPSS
jgi:ABC-type transporter Mla subunit MlaD